MPNSPVSTFVPNFHDEEAVSKMEYNKLGNTDMVVSKMTFGSSAIGSVFRKTDDSESINVLKTALKAGFNMIDTAPWYGHGKSETVLGKSPATYTYVSNANDLAVNRTHTTDYINEWLVLLVHGADKLPVLPSIPRKAYYLNTKVGRYLPEVDKMFDFRGERVIQSVDESLQRLGVEYLDVVQIHDMEFAPSLDIIINETLPALQKVKEAGKARYIGITGYPMENFKTVLERSSVQVDTILTYCHASMNDTTLHDYMPYFQSKGVGVINGSILSMGLLTERGTAAWHPAGAEIRKTCQEAVEYCKNKDVDIARIATQYSLQFPGVHTTLIGTASLTNLEKNIEVLREGITEKEQRVSDEIMDKYFKGLDDPTWEGVEVSKYRKKLQAMQQNEDHDDLLLG